MTKKPEIEVDLTRPQDCKTIAEKVAFSMGRRALYEEACEKYDSMTAMCDFFDKYPADERYPWSDTEWASHWARLERARKEIMRAVKGAE